jgi:hypothetical protein
MRRKLVNMILDAENHSEKVWTAIFMPATPSRLRTCGNGKAHPVRPNSVKPRCCMQVLLLVAARVVWETHVERARTFYFKACDEVCQVGRHRF